MIYNKIMKWEIEFYEKENGEIPVENFLNSLPPKHQAKAIREIELLEEYGIYLPFPHTRAIKGEDYKGVWELRIKVASDISRVFYFLHDGNKFVLLHGFVKKSDKTPVKELDTAKSYMNDYIGRCK